MKTLIVYQSKTGTTKKFAEEIGSYAKQKNMDVTVTSVADLNVNKVDSFDVILLGCWTHGLMIVLQHPEKEWMKMAQELPSLENKKVGLFATYKLATGTMFKKMRKQIKADVKFEIKSKHGELSDKNKEILDAFFDKGTRS